MKERDIVGFDGIYTITPHGDVFSYKYKKKRKLKPQRASQSKKGYYQVRLFQDKGDRFGKLYYIHRLMWETFKGGIPEGKEMDHINGDTANNNIDNLQLITRRRNVHKSLEERFGPSLRTHRDAIIRDYEKLGTYFKVADKWGVSHQQIYRVIKDVYHKLDCKTGKRITVRYTKGLNDKYTDNDFRSSVRKERILKGKEDEKK